METEPYVEKDEDALHQPGSQVQFKEDGQIILCEVLENTCDKEWLRYKLKVIRQQYPRDGGAKPGEEFDVSQIREGAWGGMWSIYPPGTYGPVD